MLVDFFTLCDGAYNYNGKLTIVGTIDSFNVQKLPIVVNFGLALRLQLCKEDAGSHSLTISFVDPEGQHLPGEIKAQFDAKNAVDDSHMVLAANINGFPFSKVGMHKINICVDDKSIAEYSLNIGML